MVEGSKTKSSKQMGDGVGGGAEMKGKDKGMGGGSLETQVLL